MDHLLKEGTHAACEPPHRFDRDSSWDPQMFCAVWRALQLSYRGMQLLSLEFERLAVALGASTLAPSGHAVPEVGAPSVNCVGSVPVKVMLVIFRVAVPLFESVTSVVALAVLTT